MRLLKKSPSRLLGALSLFFLISCSTTPEVYPPHALVDQILKPRAGHKGLTNRACVPSWGSGTLDQPCKWEITEYSFEDAKFRHDANELGFICNVGGRRFKICLDKPGLCRMEKKSCGIFCSKVVESEHISPDRYQFLIDANARCFQKDRYAFEAAQ